jgi:L-threonylcarbamoyladenylate synthase
VHVGNRKEIYSLAERISSKAEILIKTFWPGPLTLIFQCSEIVPDVTVADLDTIALRMPNHDAALALIRASNCPIAAPSANLAGKPSPTTAKHVLHDLEGRIDAVLDAGPTCIGVESTVLDMTVDPPLILRPGGTPYEALERVLGKIELHPIVAAEESASVERARSPGMKHKHYAPDAKMIVVEGKVSAIIDMIGKLAECCDQKGYRVGILATDETASYYEVDVVKSLGSRNDLTTVAKNLFGLLREFDEEGVDVIIAESVPAEGLGLAVMNRLRKASGYRIARANNQNKVDEELRRFLCRSQD